MTRPRGLALCSLIFGIAAWAMLAAAAVRARQGRAVDWYGIVVLWLLGSAVAIVSGHAAKRAVLWTEQEKQPPALPGLILGNAAAALLLGALLIYAIAVWSGFGY